MSLFNYASPQQHQTAYPPQPGPNTAPSGLTPGSVIMASPNTATGPLVFANSGGSGGSGWSNGLSVTGNISTTTTVTASDVLLDGVSVKDAIATLAKINERLAILVPDPAKLEKFAALKAAYEHYKLLEQICTDA
jgi:hypothetical protein